MTIVSFMRRSCDCDRRGRLGSGRGEHPTAASPAPRPQRVQCPRRYCSRKAWISALMDRVDPWHLLRLLDRLDVEVDHHGLIVAAHQHAFERLVRAGIDLLMRHIRRYEDEVAGAGLGGEFEPLAPAHARLATHYVDHALERTMMVRSGLRIRLDRDRAGPELLGARARQIDRSLAVHAGRLRRVRVERMAWDHTHAIVLPFRLGHRVPRRSRSVAGPIAGSSEPICRVYEQVDSPASNSYMSVTTFAHREARRSAS